VAEAFKYKLPAIPRTIPWDEEECAINVKRKFMQEAAWRNMFCQQWEEVAAIIYPENRNTFYYGSYNYPGMKKTEYQVDSTGMLALWRFAAICDSLLTPANMQWHGLAASNPYVMKDRATRLWFEQATRLLFKYRYEPTANYAGQNFANYLQLGAFGTMGLFIDGFSDPATGRINGLRYKSEPLGGLFITENQQGLVDGFFRWLRMTARQIYVRWGPDRFPAGLMGSLQQDSPLQYNVIHHVCRRADWDPEAVLSIKGKPWASYYMYDGGNALLEEDGYWSFPLACGRYLQAPGEVYGRGWAMMALPSLKTLNAQKRTFLKVGHRQGDPILLLADDGLLDGATLRPGSIISGGIDPETGRRLVDILPTGKIQTTVEMMQEERSIIEDMSLNSLYKVLEENPNMSATAVVELANQKGILMAPTMGRQQSEYLGSGVVREIDELSRQGKLPPMPPRLREAHGEYDVVYTTPMSRTVRGQEVTGFMRTIEMAKEVAAATGDPSVMKFFSLKRAIPGIAETQSVPESYMATPGEIAAYDKATAQAQQQKQAADAAPGQAAMLNAQTKAAQAGQQAQNGAVPPPGVFAPIKLQPQSGAQ
jgi:hypothetical protein